MAQTQQPTGRRIEPQDIQVGQRAAARRKRRRQRPKRFPVRGAAAANLDRHPLRQVPEQAQALCRQGQDGTAPKTSQAGVREILFDFQRAGKYSVHRRTCRVVLCQPALCWKIPCTMRLSDRLNCSLSGDWGFFAGSENSNENYGFVCHHASSSRSSNRLILPPTHAILTQPGGVERSHGDGRE